MKNWIAPVITGGEIIELQKITREVFIADELISKVSHFIRNTRPGTTTSELVSQYVDFGAGPRAGQAIIMAAKAHAILDGRYSVVPNDIKRVLLPALRHRILLNFKAESEKQTPDGIILELSKTIF